MIPIRDRLPTRRAPVVNYALIALNVLVFLWERAELAAGVRPARLLDVFGLVPAQVTSAPVAHGFNVLSSMFMHDPTSIGHIAGNMLFLWIFGDNVEDALGRLGYAAFYLLAGVAAAAAQIVIDPSSTVPMVGASGAIAGVLAAYVSLYPRAPVTVLNPIPILWLFFGLFIELPAWVVIAEFFLFNLYNALTSPLGQGGVAFFAHLGGFVAGLFLVRVFTTRPQDHDRWGGFRPPARPGYPAGGLRPRPRRPWDE
jgi:membrane associated rhomboid family serine protease